MVDLVHRHPIQQDEILVGRPSTDVETGFPVIRRDHAGEELKGTEDIRLPDARERIAHPGGNGREARFFLCLKQ